jgi:hypothetical protein
MRTQKSSNQRLMRLFGGLLLILAVLPIAALLALGSGPARSKIASVLSNRLGLPVAIGKLNASLFPTPVVYASSIQVGGVDSAAAPGVFLRTLRIVPRLKSILPGQTLTAEDVDLTDLIISVRRDTTGRWLLPVPPSVPSWQSTDSSLVQHKVDLKKVRVRQGSVRVVDEMHLTPTGGPTVTTINGVEADLEVLGGKVKVSRFTGRQGEDEVTGATDMIASKQLEWKVERRLLELVLELEAQAGHPMQDSIVSQQPSVTPLKSGAPVTAPRSLNDRLSKATADLHAAAYHEVVQ